MSDQPTQDKGEWTPERIEAEFYAAGALHSVELADAINALVASERSAKVGFQGLWNTAERQRSHLEKELNKVTDDAGKLVQQLREQLAAVNKSEAKLIEICGVQANELAAAQAAMRECDYCSLKEHDTSALDTAIAEAKKPLVEALKQAYAECEGTHFRVAQRTISVAIAKVEEGK